MADVQATFDFSLELTHFYNVDLYVGGYYQIRALLKAPKKQPCKIEISIPRSIAPHLFPASVVNGRAVGTTFEILYRDEDIELIDIIEFKVFLPIKFSKLAKTMSFTLILELWYIDKEEMVKKAADDVFAAFECVSKRYLTLNVPVFRGLHYHRPVIFDYFHLCAVTFTLHASLTGLAKAASTKQEKFVKTKGDSSSQLVVAPNSTGTTQNSSPKPSTSGISINYLPFEEAIFGSTSKSASNRLQNSYQFHRNVCWLLLTAYEALELKLTQLLTCLPSRYQIRIQSVDCAKKFEVLQQNIQRLTDESDIVAAVESTTNLLSAELNLLWNQFLDLFRSQTNIAAHLAKEHHSARVRRFAESFFCTETSTLALLVHPVGQTLKIQEKLVDHLRKSAYFQQPLPLGIACDDGDGTPEVIPVVFEEKYHPIHRTQHQSSFDECLQQQQPRKLASKDSLSLDLIHVHKPAPAAPQDKSKLTGRGLTVGFAEGTKKSVRKKLFSRSSSVKIWRRTGKILTFPLSNVELTKFERKNEQHKPSAPILTNNGGGSDRTIFGSMPNLRYNKFTATNKQPTMSTQQTSLDQVDLQLSENKNLRKIDSDPSLCSTAKLKLAPAPELDKIENGAYSDDVFDPNDDYSSSSNPRRASDETSSGSHITSPSEAPHAPCDVITSPSQLPSSEDAKPRLTSGVEQDVLSFVAAKEEFKQKMKSSNFDGHVCSDFTTYPSQMPYFAQWADRDFEDDSVDYHLIVCVHGLDGTSADLRMVRAYIELGLCSTNLKFLMSKRNQVNTFDDFETMTKNLVDEVLLHLSQCSVQPSRISFIGHSLGNIIIRSALSDPRLEPWLERLHTFLSLNGPHCGILYNNNSVVNMGIRLVQRWKKSISLQQLALKDSADFRECFLYKLSQKPCLQFFKNVLLVGSYDDYYVPIHSALIQVCRAVVKDSTSLGSVYTEMVQNLAEPLVNSSRTTVVRYSVYHSLQASSTTSQLLGRAAHIAVLDSDLFIEKLLTVSALRYFE